MSAKQKPVSPSKAAPAAARAKHKQISEEILSAVEAGRWLPGDRLPSEEQLASEMGASTGTVQRSLRSLVEMGVVERRHGSGTYVSGALAQEKQLVHFRFTAEGSSQLLPVYFKIIGVESTRAQGPWGAFFTGSGPEFVHIRRVASVNEEFDVFSEIYLTADRFADLGKMSEATLNGVSFRDMLAERFNAPTLKTRQTMFCKVLPPRVTRQIGVPAGQYGIVWTIVGYSYRDVPITWQRIFVPPSDRGIEIAPVQVSRPVPLREVR